MFNAVAATDSVNACGSVGSTVAVYGTGADTQFISGHTYYYADGSLLNTSGHGYPTGAYWSDPLPSNAWVITNGIPISSLVC